jgi:C-terminal processing protease CtpA/Prc
VYIAVMDQDGFAAKSGKLQVQDRILACNGCDFTKDMPNSRVEEIFSEMLVEPLLKMAISRGGFRGNLQGSRADEAPPGTMSEERGVASGGEEVGVVSVDGSSVSVDVTVNEDEAKWVESPLARPTIKTVGM